ncbi:hypothetical protein V6N12_058194 [Hibiscus sabdariffa]|uniref:Uncharacterized protein n=1 Tax=Hibiscus sabdariffa TaxID=183260 RepID=A0ABR2ERG7_9ROSI
MLHSMLEGRYIDVGRLTYKAIVDKLHPRMFSRYLITWPLPLLQCYGHTSTLSSAPRSCRYCISFYTRHNSTSVEESANGGAKLNFSFDAQASSLPPKKAKDKGKAPRSPIMIAPASLVHLSDEATIDASAPSRAASLTITLQHLPLLSHQ